MNRTSPIHRMPIWLIAFVVVLLGLGTSLLMAARAVADGRADSLLAALTTPPERPQIAAGRLDAPGERLADSRNNAAEPDGDRGRTW